MSSPRERWDTARMMHMEACKEFAFSKDREEYSLACKIHALEEKLFYLRRANERVRRDKATVFRMINGIKENTIPKGKEEANGMEKKAP